jgi:hypothetical protein
MVALRMVGACIFGILCAGEAQACKCVVMTSSQQFDVADTVLVGVAESVELIDVASHVIKAEVLVERAWKGSTAGRISVLTDGTCAVEFERGRRYLVYARRVSAQDYGTGKCDGTARLDVSSRARRALRALSRRAQ